MEKKDEKILKKVGKLLKLYGVTDEEKEKFLMDLQDKKYDDQEEINEVSEDSEETVEPTEEPMGGEEAEPMEAEPVEGEEDAEEPAPMEEAPMEEDPAGDMAEQDVGETPDQEPVEPMPMEQPEQPMGDQPIEPTPEPMGMEQPNANEETQKTIDGLVARIESLEDMIKKMGVKVDDSFGTSPANEGSESCEESEFDRINRLRRGN